MTVLLCIFCQIEVHLNLNQSDQSDADLLIILNNDKLLTNLSKVLCGSPTDGLILFSQVTADQSLHRA